MRIGFESCVWIICICILHALHVLIVMANSLILNIIFLSFVTLLLEIWKNLHYLLHLNDSMNDTVVDSNSDEEIVLDITGFHDEKVLDKQSLIGCDRSESYLNEERNDTLNGRR